MIGVDENEVLIEAFRETDRGISEQLVIVSIVSK